MRVQFSLPTLLKNDWLYMYYILEGTLNYEKAAEKIAKYLKSKEVVIRRVGDIYYEYLEEVLDIFEYEVSDVESFDLAMSDLYDWGGGRHQS